MQVGPFPPFFMSREGGKVSVVFLAHTFLSQAPLGSAGLLARIVLKFSVSLTSGHHTLTQQNPSTFLFPPHVLALTLQGAFSALLTIGLLSVHLLLV